MGAKLESNPMLPGAAPAAPSMPRKPWQKQAIIIRMTLLSLLLITIYGLITMDYKRVSLGEGLSKMLANFQVLFTEPHLKNFTFAHALEAVLITLCLAVLTTLIGAIIALIPALLAAHNLSLPWVANAIKGAVAFIRAVPTVLWVLIFAVSAGLGSVAAVIGMTFHSVGYLIKAYSESFEEVEPGVIEALKGSGAGWWQIVFQAVLPSTLTYLISWTFLRFEINFAAAIAMGAAAGAGGIGFDMFMASNFYHDLREVGSITYFILIFAVLIEVFATRLKGRMKGKH